MTSQLARSPRKIMLAAVALVLTLAATAAYARSISLTGAQITHYWDIFQFTKYEAEGGWSPDTGDTVIDLVLEKAPSGTDNFSTVSTSAEVVSEDRWNAEGESLHNGAAFHLRGGIVYSPSGGGQGVIYSSKSAALSCEG